MSGMIDGRSLHVIGNPQQCEWLILQPADMEETEMDKVTIVGNINLAREEKNVRTND